MFATVSDAVIKLSDTYTQYIAIKRRRHIIAARCYASAAYVVICVRQCVRLSVTFVHSVETNKLIFKLFRRRDVARPF